MIASGSGDGDDCECEEDGGSDYYAVFLIDECDDDGDGVDARGL